MKKQIIIVDIDGTVSKVGDRLKYLQQKPVDWDSFYDACFEDKPIMGIINLVQICSLYYRIIFCTGRRESVREKTEKWIKRYCINIERPEIIMRPDGDWRHDTESKPEQLNKYGINLNDIEFVLEDRNSMVKKWRELGVKCLQVADGDF